MTVPFGSPPARSALAAALFAVLAACEVDLAPDETPAAGEVASCAALCVHAEDASTSEAECATLEFVDLGYNLLLEPQCAAIAGSEVGCNSCMDDLGASDGDCAAVFDACLAR